MPKLRVNILWNLNFFFLDKPLKYAKTSIPKKLTDIWYYMYVWMKTRVENRINWKSIPRDAGFYLSSNENIHNKDCCTVVRYKIMHEMMRNSSIITSIHFMSIPSNAFCFHIELPVMKIPMSSTMRSLEQKKKNNIELINYKANRNFEAKYCIILILTRIICNC